MKKRIVEAMDKTAKAVSGHADFVKSVSKEAFDIANGYATALDTKFGLRERHRRAAEVVEQGYGDARAWLWKRKSPRTSRELLQVTHKELNYVIACILQTSPRNAAQWSSKFSKALAAKLASVGGTGTLLTLVATYGTAGTGAAISGLSGAAATSATLAWIGGLVGGGMLAGTVITGGLGLLIGFGIYKGLGSNARNLEALDGVEKGVVEACAVIVAMVDEALAETPEQELAVEHAETIYRKVLVPLHNTMVSHCDAICANLDAKNAIAFRQHALRDFKCNVLVGFDEFVNQNRGHVLLSSESYLEYVIGGVFYALLSQDAVGDDPESQMVLDAIRRSDGSLNGASEEEIADYLSDRSPEALRGIAINVKGIYHEMVYVKQYNATHTDTYAELHSATNHTGADVFIRDRETGAVRDEIQLKATDSPSYVRQHQERYPDIQVLATDEVAKSVNGVEPSSFRNAELDSQVNRTFEDLPGDSEIEQGLDSAGLAALVAAGRNAVDVLQGKNSAGNSARNVLQSAGISGSSTILAAFLFG